MYAKEVHWRRPTGDNGRYTGDTQGGTLEDARYLFDDEDVEFAEDGGQLVDRLRDLEDLLVALARRLLHLLQLAHLLGGEALRTVRIDATRSKSATRSGARQHIGN